MVITAGEILIQILGGVCLLLWGVNMVGTGLNKAFGTSLRHYISTYTSNPVKAVGVGAFVAIGLQSSMATCMIVSSFAARNVIKGSAAIAVMLGADVGTTIAAQIMSLDLKWLMPVLIASGYIVSKAMKNSLYKHFGGFFVGIGLVLLALSYITGTAEHLKSSEVLPLLMEPLQAQPIMAVLFSLIFTWLVHSSLGVVLLYMSFVASGTLPVDIALYMVLGANLGGAIAPVVMTAKELPSGKRIPLANLFMRFIGVLIIMPLMKEIVIPLVGMVQADNSRMIVNFHTMFNVAMVVMFLPFVGHVRSLMKKLVPDPEKEDDETLPKYLDLDALKNPTAALACACRETLRLCDIVEVMFDDSLYALRTNNYQILRRICDQELVVDSLYKSIKNYLSRMASKNMTEEEIFKYMQVLSFSTNLEHAGDVIDKSLLKIVRKKINNQDSFSRQGYAEIADIHSQVKLNIQKAQNLLMTDDYMIAEELLDSKVDLREREMKGLELHLKRLSEGVAETVATSTLHMDVVRDLRRINSYISLIAHNVKKRYKQKRQELLEDSSDEELI